MPEFRLPRRGRTGRWRAPIAGMAFVVTSVLLLQWVAVSLVSAAPIDSFVTRDGAQLSVAGRPYRFSGFDIYNANSDDWCNYGYTDSELSSAFQQIGPGASDPNTYPQDGAVVRAWFFQPMAASKSPGSTHQWSGARDWTRFDRTLADAKAAGVRLIVTLTDEWGECGDNASSIKRDDWYRGGYTTPNPADTAIYDHWVSYRDWVQEVVNRYAGHTEILAWQLINEGEASAADWSCPSDANAIMRSWATDVSGLIKSLDPNHLISLGTIGSGQCGAGSTAEYTALHALPNIDLCEWHDYGAPNVAIPGDQYNGLQNRIDACASLGKPMFLGEVGIRPEEVGPTIAAGDGFTCALRYDTNESASCWGDPALNLAKSPFDAIAITAGSHHACRLQPDLTVACWGADDEGQSTVPAAASPASRISAGGLHSCAVRRADSMAICWGSNASGESAVPAAIGVVRDVGAGSDFSCAIRGDGSVGCWGANDAGQASPPATGHQALALALGAKYGCELRDDGIVACWGLDDAGQTDVPAGLTNVATISAGSRHACASRSDGSVVCWGDNTSGKASPPAIVALGSVAAGVDHSCAIVNDSTVRCWGANGSGQSGPPSGLFTTLVHRRTDAFQAKLVAAEQEGVVGVLVWHYSQRQIDPTLDSYDMGPASHEPLLLAKSRIVVPSVPRNVVASPGDGSVCGTWDPPADDGGAPITGYTLVIDPGATQYDVGVGNNVCAGGYTDGVSYTVRIRAINDTGIGIANYGPFSTPSNPVMPGHPPAAPQAVVVAAGDAGMSVSWAPPDGVDPANPITSYIVDVGQFGLNSPAPHATPLIQSQRVTVGGAITTATITGLQNGTQYAVNVRATNANGQGANSPLSNIVTPTAGATPPQTTAAAIDPSGGSSTTDPGNAGPTPVNPVTTSVSVPATPGGGTVTIAESSTLDPAPPGYAFAGQQISIVSTAPTSETAPLRITFRIDPSFVPAVIFRNGVPISASCQTPGVANPTPCIESGGGTASVTVLTAQASTWNIGFSAFAFSGFDPPISNLPAINVAKSGSSIPVKFGLGANRGTDIFAAGYPKSQGIVCGSSVAVAGVDPVTDAAGSGLSVGKDGRYQFQWKTDKAWTGCRALVLKFRDGSFARAAFNFK